MSTCVSAPHHGIVLDTSAPGTGDAPAAIRTAGLTPAYVDRRRHRPAARGSESPQPGRRAGPDGVMRVRVVDDDIDVRESLRRILIFEGYDVTTAEDGQRALDRIALERPDAVLLDLQMLHLDGLGACRRLRSAGNDVPVLMLTARDGTGDRVTGWTSAPTTTCPSRSPGRNSWPGCARRLPSPQDRAGRGAPAAAQRTRHRVCAARTAGPDLPSRLPRFSAPFNWSAPTAAVPGHRRGRRRPPRRHLHRHDGRARGAVISLGLLGRRP